MVLTLWPPSGPFGNRAANYQSWEHRSTDLSGHRRRVDRLAARNRRTRVATGHFTDSFSLPLPRCTLPSFRRLSARQPVQKALFHSPSNGILDSLHFVSCLPAAPVLFYQRFHSLSPPFSKSGGDGVATVSCWQLFRVLKRAAKKFWLCRLPLTLVMPVVLAADYTDLRRFVETEIVREKKKRKKKNTPSGELVLAWISDDGQRRNQLVSWTKVTPCERGGVVVHRISESSAEPWGQGERERETSGISCGEYSHRVPVREGRSPYRAWKEQKSICYRRNTLRQKFIELPSTVALNPAEGRGWSDRYTRDLLINIFTRPRAHRRTTSTCNDTINLWRISVA